MLRYNKLTKETVYKANSYAEQISDSKIVYGNFRKRSEDALEIVRPKHLPPIRNKLLGTSEQSFLTGLKRIKLYKNMINRFENEPSKSTTNTPDGSPFATYRMNYYDNHNKKSIYQLKSRYFNFFIKSYRIYDERMKLGDYIKYEEVDKEIFLIDYP